MTSEPLSDRRVGVGRQWQSAPAREMAKHLGSALGGNLAMLIDPPEELSLIGPFASTVILAFGVLVTWISLAIAVKRYHDRDKSGWWVLIIFLPVIGGIWYLIECGFLRGTDGNNDYGPDPLARY